MECPRCHKPLAEVSSGWACPDDHGHFVPADVLAEQAHVVRRLAKAKQTTPSVACPGCRMPMVLTHPRGFDVDVCSCGGVWLDDGEETLMQRRNAAGFVEGVAEIAFWAWIFS